MRDKENANDYRYFPDPDLSFPLTVSDELLEKVKNNMPELPDKKRDRFIKEYNIAKDDAVRLVNEISMANFFESAVKVKGAEAKKTANLILIELSALLSDRKLQIEDLKIKPEWVGKLSALVEDGTIGLRTAKDLIIIMQDEAKDPETLIEEKGLKQVSDTSEIEKIIDGIIEANPNEVAGFKAGKEKLMGFFVGQVMKATSGKANPAIINKLLKEKLSK